MTSRSTYTVFEQLGVGGMASVHRAERRVGTTRQRVALKRLLPHAAEDPQLVELFLHEARIAARLLHRNIAQIYDSGQIDDECFIAMEYVAGPTVNQLMRSVRETVGHVPFPIVIKVLSEVCDALAYAHTRTDEKGHPLGLVHRDVSPSNVVISSNGVVKLIDFGVAKTTTSCTAAGIIKGKLGYVAPEYIAGQCDHRADLWAVGVVAWEMLTGQRLFKSEDDLSTLQMVKSQPIDPPSVHNSDVPPELDAIVMTALHREPKERWQNAEALRNALLGVAAPSTHAEIVEWVEWVMKLAERGLRPPRGSRPLPMGKAKAQCIVLPSAAKTIALAAMPSTPSDQALGAEPVIVLPLSAATVALPVAKPVGTPGPLRAREPTPRPAREPSPRITTREPTSRPTRKGTPPSPRELAAAQFAHEPTTDPFKRAASIAETLPFEREDISLELAVGADAELTVDAGRPLPANEPAIRFRRPAASSAPPAHGLLRAPASREDATVASGRRTKLGTAAATAFSSAQPPAPTPRADRLSGKQLAVGILLSLSACALVVASLLLI